MTWSETLKTGFFASQPILYHLGRKHYTGFIQGSLSKIHGLFKDFQDYFTVFKDKKFRKNTDRSVKILLQKCWTEIMEKLVLENEYEIVVPLFGAANAAPNKGTAILYWYRILTTALSSTENRRIQGLFKAFEWFPSTFQGRFNFQGLFKKAL